MFPRDAPYVNSKVQGRMSAIAAALVLSIEIAGRSVRVEGRANADAHARSEQPRSCRVKRDDLKG